MNRYLGLLSFVYCFMAAVLYSLSSKVIRIMYPEVTGSSGFLQLFIIIFAIACTLIVLINKLKPIRNLNLYFDSAFLTFFTISSMSIGLVFGNDQKNSEFLLFFLSIYSLNIVLAACIIRLAVKALSHNIKVFKMLTYSFGGIIVGLLMHMFDLHVTIYSTILLIFSLSTLIIAIKVPNWLKINQNR